MAGNSHAYRFTVFTATYNRRHTLPRLYASLCAQTYKDFEWLLVDDGSSDGTAEMIRGWQQLLGMEIRYVLQDHKGKHAAFNRGVVEARGDLFVDIGSDDACLPAALERLNYHWQNIPENRRPLFSGVTGLCIDQHGKLLGNRFPYDSMDSHCLEARFRYHVKGEKFGFQKTDILREFPFPEISGYTGCIPEILVWDAIGRRFKTRYVNEVLRQVWIREEGRTDQLTDYKSRTRHAAGFALACKTQLNCEQDWLPEAIPDFLKSAANFSRFSLHVSKGPVAQAAMLENWTARALWAAMLPLGTLLYAGDRTRIMDRLIALSR
jgi:glycosyltransferase involved in cell wall biosynthesis